MIVLVDRNGPPEAMTCPVFLCDDCLEPIQGDRPGIVIWRSAPHGPDHRPAQQEHAHTHKGMCNRRYEAAHPGQRWMWRDLDELLAQLTLNTAETFDDEPNVEYLAPSPSTWRQGHYERKATR